MGLRLVSQMSRIYVLQIKTLQKLKGCQIKIAYYDNHMTWTCECLEENTESVLCSHLLMVLSNTAPLEREQDIKKMRIIHASIQGTKAEKTIRRLWQVELEMERVKQEQALILTSLDWLKKTRCEEVN